MSFDFFDGPDIKPSPNLEEVVQRFHDESLDFDKFDNVEGKGDHSKSFNSEFFNTDPEPEQRP
jgi:hypothetical protein